MRIRSSGIMYSAIASLGCRVGVMGDIGEDEKAFDVFAGEYGRLSELYGNSDV